MPEIPEDIDVEAAVKALITAAEVVLADNGLEVTECTEGFDPNLGELSYCASVLSRLVEDAG